MAVYSFYIFDRHTECIYRKRWLPLPQPTTTKPPASTSTTTTSTSTVPNTSTSSTASTTTTTDHPPPPPPKPSNKSRLLKDDDDAKLIFGTVFSLRNMVRKLGGADDHFISYRTGHYKLHYYETASSLKFVMLSDTKTNNLRIVLHQIYVNLYVEYVVKNPLSPVEHSGGVGVANTLFELALDQFISGGV